MISNFIFSSIKQLGSPRPNFALKKFGLQHGTRSGRSNFSSYFIILSKHESWNTFSFSSIFPFFLSSHILFYFQHLWLSDFFSLLFIRFYSYLHLICPFVHQYVLLRMSPKGIFCFKCHHSIYIDYFLSYNKYVGWVGSSIYKSILLTIQWRLLSPSRSQGPSTPPTFRDFRAFITCTGLELPWFSIWINKPRYKSFIGQVKSRCYWKSRVAITAKRVR